MTGPRRFTTVLFDLDDTLIDSLEARVSAVRSVFSTAGLAPDPAQFIRDLNGGHIQRALDSLENEGSATPGLFELYKTVYWNADRSPVPAYPGISQLLDSLRTSRIRLGVVTQKARSFEFAGRLAGAFRELSEAGIASFFPVVIGFEDVTRVKPDPEGILTALDRLGSIPDETLFIGDSAADMGAAKSAGCRACLATWGTGEGLTIRADVTLRRPHDLLELTSGA